MRPLDPRLLPHLTPAAAPAGRRGARPQRRWPACSSSPRPSRSPGWSSPGRPARRRPPGRRGRCAGGRRWPCGAAPAGRWTRCAARAAAAVGTALRRRLVAPAARRRGAGRRAAQRRARRAGHPRRRRAVEPYLTRYLPALVLAAVLPPLTLVGDRDPGPAQRARSWSLTLPLVPVFAALVGLATRDRAAAASGGSWPPCPGTSSTWCAGCRRWSPTAGRRGAVGVDPRDHRALPAGHLDTLRIAFASSAVLELSPRSRSRWSRWTVGLRLAARRLDLEPR